MSLDLSMKNLRGTPTGYTYEDGSPVLIGDRIDVRGTDRPGTVRGRYTRFGGMTSYITYTENDKTFQVGMKEVNGYGFRKYDGPDWRTFRNMQKEKGKDKKMSSLPKGKYIIGLLDYDDPIIMNV